MRTVELPGDEYAVPVTVRAGARGWLRPGHDGSQWVIFDLPLGAGARA